jgi:hypothetical protein
LWLDDYLYLAFFPLNVSLKLRMEGNGDLHIDPQAKIKVKLF